MEVKLANEKWKHEKAEGILAEKEQKIKTLQDDVDQKDRELNEEKDDKQEKCGQLKEQLEQAHGYLKMETAAKEKAEAEVAEVKNTLGDLQCDVDRASREVEIAREEREKIKHVLRWTDSDLLQEQDELRLISEWVEKRNRGIRYTILGLLSMTVILAGVLIEIIRRYQSC